MINISVNLLAEEAPREGSREKSADSGIGVDLAGAVYHANRAGG